MTAAKASLVNAIILIAISAYGYFASATPSITALIPAIFGVLLLACNPGVKKENKIVAHIAVFLTLFVFAGLFMALRGAIERENMEAVARVSVMGLSTIFALVYFIKSFIDARKAK